jgi:hypothetical protein
VSSAQQIQAVREIGPNTVSTFQIFVQIEVPGTRGIAVPVATAVAFDTHKFLKLLLLCLSELHCFGVTLQCVTPSDQQ